MIPRLLTPRILEALADTPVVFLTGARQTGKSTLARAIAAGDHPARYITFDDATALVAAAGDPEGFVAGLSGPVVLDEVHYLADRERGAVWEELIIQLPESVAIAALSATVSNVEEFGAWMATVRGDTRIVLEEHRPVPLWQQVMANYLVTRENLKGIVLLCDPRHGLTELDEILLDVIRPRVAEGLKFLVVLTKADKLNKTEQTKALSIMNLQAGGGEVRLFSATKRIGIDDVAELLWKWAHPVDAIAGALAT